MRGTADGPRRASEMVVAWSWALVYTECEPMAMPDGLGERRGATVGHEGESIGHGACVLGGRVAAGVGERRLTAGIAGRFRRARRGLCVTRAWLPGRPLTGFGRRRPNLPLPQERGKTGGSSMGLTRRARPSDYARVSQERVKSAADLVSRKPFAAASREGEGAGVRRELVVGFSCGWW